MNVIDSCLQTKEDRHYKTMAWQKNKLERLERKMKIKQVAT